jgi:fumarylacetoacetate (FAA) hydrolase family protein
MECTMPALSGSEKQVRWAEEIRARVLAALDSAAQEMGATPKQLAAVRDVLLGQTSAGWWIDVRRMPLAELVDKADCDAMMGVGRDKALRRRPLQGVLYE